MAWFGASRCGDIKIAHKISNHAMFNMICVETYVGKYFNMEVIGERGGLSSISLSYD